MKLCKFLSTIISLLFSSTSHSETVGNSLSAATNKDVNLAKHFDQEIKTAKQPSTRCAIPINNLKHTERIVREKLKKAIEDGRMKDTLSIQEYIKNYASIDVLNSVDNRSKSLLELCVKYKRYGLAEALLQNGANPNLRNRKLRTPLIVAVLKNDIKMTSLLLSYGADPTIEDINRFNAYVSACTLKDNSIIALLISSRDLRKNLDSTSTRSNLDHVK